MLRHDSILRTFYLQILPNFNNFLILFQLIPLYVCVGAGMFGAFFYTMRLATRNPDVAWGKRVRICENFPHFKIP
jgi:hypothetical protein